MQQLHITNIASNNKKAHSSQFSRWNNFYELSNVKENLAGLTIIEC